MVCVKWTDISGCVAINMGTLYPKSLGGDDQKMIEEPITWQKEYALGVDFIDEAHQQLFLVIYRFLSVVEDRDTEKRKALCEAMLRYLIKYTLNHFKQEEAYMRKIKYSGYEIHKQLHDNLKNNTIPHLNSMLEEQKYSNDAIERFSAVLLGWLASHILVEDCAITGEKKSRWDNDIRTLDTLVLLDNEFKLFAADLFGLKLELVNKHFSGEYLGDNTYTFFATIASDTREYKTLLLCNGTFIHYVIRRLIGVDDKELNNGALEAFEMIAQSWAKAAVSIINRSSLLVVNNSYSLNKANYSSFFEKPHPQYGLIWRAGEFQVGIAVK